MSGTCTTFRLAESGGKKQVFTARQKQILDLMDAYNRHPEAPGYVSPFIAEANGDLEPVAKKMGVPEDELRTFLKFLNTQLPPVE